jgi:hypothetical protein
MGLPLPFATVDQTMVDSVNAGIHQPYIQVDGPDTDLDPLFYLADMVLSIDTEVGGLIRRACRQYPVTTSWASARPTGSIPHRAAVVSPAASPDDFLGRLHPAASPAGPRREGVPHVTVRSASTHPHGSQRVCPVPSASCGRSCRPTSRRPSTGCCTSSAGRPRGSTRSWPTRATTSASSRSTGTAPGRAAVGRTSDASPSGPSPRTSSSSTSSASPASPGSGTRRPASSPSPRSSGCRRRCASRPSSTAPARSSSSPPGTRAATRA